MNQLHSIYYHGTTRDVVPRIKREGLRPVLDRAFDFQTPQLLQYTESNDRTRRGYIFITADKSAAEMFARFRAQYEMYPSGTIHAHTVDGVDMVYIKMPNEFRRHGIHPAQPVVLELMVPKPLAAEIEPDDRAKRELAAFQLHGILPAKCIRRVIPVHGMEHVTYDTQTNTFSSTITDYAA